MQFISILERRDGVSESDLTGLRGQETDRARLLYSEGFIRHIWHRADKAGACLLWEADTGERVHEMLKTLPFVQAGFVDVVLIPLKPYAGFGPTVP